jgi:hypothetical protein
MTMTDNGDRRPETTAGTTLAERRRRIPPIRLMIPGRDGRRDLAIGRYPFLVPVVRGTMVLAMMHVRADSREQAREKALRHFSAGLYAAQPIMREEP